MTIRMIRINIILIFLVIKTFAINYDSIVKTNPLNVIFKTNSMKVYRKIPSYICIESKICWPNIDKKFEEVVNGPRELLHYCLGLHSVTSPDYELISKFPPPVSIEIINLRSKDISKFNFHPNSYHFNTTGFPEDYRFEEFPDFTIRPEKIYYTYVDLRQFMFDLDTGSYEIKICYKHNQVLPFENKTHFRIQLVDITDTVTNILSKYLPKYMEQPGLDHQSEGGGITFYNFLIKNKFIGLPIIRQEEVDYLELQRKLPKDIFSQLSPYLFFNLVYNKRTITKNALILLNNFPDILLPLAASLRYESEFLMKEKDAKKMKKEVLEKYPGEVWRIEKIEKNKGIIQTLINMGKAKESK